MEHKVEAVGGVTHKRKTLSIQERIEKRIQLEKQARAKATGKTVVPRWQQSLDSKHAVKKYSCYLLFLNTVQHLQLGNLQEQAVAQANLMNVQHSIQQCLLKISNFMSTLKSNATGQAALTSKEECPGFTSFDPNAFNGLKRSYFSEFLGQENPSNDYQNDVKSFVLAVKDLFYAGTNSTYPKMSELSNIKNPNIFPHGKDFDLTSFWGQTNSKYSQFNVDGHNVFATKPTETTSLIQQYCYYKAQVAVLSGSKANVNAANGDINKLVNFDVTDQECDPVITSSMQLLTDFQPITVSRGESNVLPWNASKTTESGLSMILNDQLYPEKEENSSVRDSIQQQKDGLYGYFAKASFNYFWSKNPGGTLQNTDTAPTTLNWQKDSHKGVDGANVIDQVALSTSGLQTNYGQSVGESSVQIQSVTTTEGQDVNIVQGGLSGKKQVDGVFINNQKSE